MVKAQGTLQSIVIASLSCTDTPERAADKVHIISNKALNKNNVCIIWGRKKNQEIL